MWVRRRRLRGPAITDIKHDHVRDRSDLDALRGPAITEIDSPRLRGGPRLTRPRAFSLPSIGGTWVETGVGISWEHGNRIGLSLSRRRGGRSGLQSCSHAPMRLRAPLRPASERKYTGT